MNFIDIAWASSEEEATTLEQTSNSGQESVAASLGLNGQLFAFQLLNFVIVAVVIWFLILKPLVKQLEERRKIIDESLNKAKKIDENMAQSQAEFSAKLDEARGEANKIIEKAGIEADNLVGEIKIKSKKEIEGLVEQAKRNIKIEQEEMLLSLKAETAELVVAAVEKILEEKLNDKKDKELVESALKDLKK
ncbi:MAG: hypothetical protein ACD_72C00458G0003 [uncultured bacterium]|uniref:ATP synthase subunit b n=1 Tax=Candidatus Magasanikbacteria bacterium GW2011_GWA2_42_32 TaxID=1619039 RepID=A0A0G1A971_9BACT|nr:MAG: hypothetical protein ACD_72C00458G0003 [uncultured bacterium]KKR49177.1 MAG: ATP synthase subunit b [Candidatus Magasanikbacteria bacterium GW2011_GWC2_40_17]KKS57509.1 MAG: ATP synthase subunit b [Candidatus Magasanikbacteria bacterium GW2011_GWA2_42_32]OGH85225.1 MAG: ATP synthase F0 subunit B [Candidatus Magasanikbacteria bacterium RIFOXYB2_FULL_38_10]